MSTILQRNLRTHIQSKAISVHALEIKAGLKPSAIQNILQGKSKKPAADLLVAIARVLDCSVEQLICDPQSCDNMNLSKLYRIRSGLESPESAKIEVRFNSFGGMPEYTHTSYNTGDSKTKELDDAISELDSTNPIDNLEQARPRNSIYFLVPRTSDQNSNYNPNIPSIRDAFALTDSSEKRPPISLVQTKEIHDSLQILHSRSIDKQLECSYLAITSQTFNFPEPESLGKFDSWLLNLILTNLNKIELNPYKVLPVPRELGFLSKIEKYALDEQGNLELRSKKNIASTESINQPANLLEGAVQFARPSRQHTSDQKLIPYQNKHLSQWIPDLYIDCFAKMQQILDGLGLSLDKASTLKIVDEAYLYSIQGSIPKADLIFINWIISKHLNKV